MKSRSIAAIFKPFARLRKRKERKQQCEDCPICLSAIRQPKTLHCGHRLCHGCLKDLKAASQVTNYRCPMCRAMIDKNSTKSLVKEYLTNMRTLKIMAHKSVNDREKAIAARTRAVGALEECLEIDPDHSEAMVLLADLLQDDLPRRVELLRNAFEMQPETDKSQLSKLHYKLGKSLLKLSKNRSNLEEVEYHLRQATIVSQGKTERELRFRAHCYLAFIYKNTERTEKAIEAFKAALQENPNDIDVQFKIAACYESIGKYPEALLGYNQILASDPYFLQSNMSLLRLYERILIIEAEFKQKKANEDEKTDQIRPLFGTLFDEEKACLAYLNCILRAEALSSTRSDKLECQYHRLEFQKYFPSEWANWIQTGRHENSPVFWIESEIETHEDGSIIRRLIVNDVISMFITD